jgi:hypothetical protein
MLGVIMLSPFMQHVIMLTVVIPRISILNGIMLTVFVLNVTAPSLGLAPSLPPPLHQVLQQCYTIKDFIIQWATYDSNFQWQVFEKINFFQKLNEEASRCSWALLNKQGYELEYCDIGIVHKLRRMPKLKVVSKEETSGCLSGEHCNFDDLWFKVTRTLVSPIEIEPVKLLYFLCVVFLWEATSLSLSRISSFKRSWEFVIGISTCL